MSATTVTAPAPTASEQPTSTLTTTANPTSSTVDDATYMMNSFSGLLEGDLYDDELNEITTLFAPAVSDDEDGMSNKESSSPVPSLDYDENHPGTQVAVAAAAIDNALQAVDPTKIAATVAPTPVLSTSSPTPVAVAPAPVNANKRTYDQAMPAAAPAPAHKRRVTLDGTKRITLSSSCGSLSNLPAKAAAAALVPAPVSPTSVAAAPVAVPSSPTLAAVESAPKIPSVTESQPTTVTPTNTTTTASAAAATKKPVAKKAKGTITIRQGMTPEEKAKACRERNREHARKTRLRKKAYVDELKRSLNEMVEQRDAAKAMEEQKAKITEQNRDVRFQVMQDFLNLRGNNEQSPQRWAAILVPEEFQLKLPATDFQTMVPAKAELNAAPGQQVLATVPDIMADASFFSAFLQTLGNNNNNNTNNSDAAVSEAASPIFFSYNCQRDTFLMDGCQAMFNFDGTSCGAVQQGASSELIMSGTFRATFCPDTNRLRAAQFMFDTGSIRFQLELQKQKAATAVKAEPSTSTTTN